MIPRGTVFTWKTLTILSEGRIIVVKYSVRMTKSLTFIRKNLYERETNWREISDGGDTCLVCL